MSTRSRTRSCIDASNIVQLPGPSDLARYIAVSASRSSASAVSEVRPLDRSARDTDRSGDHHFDAAHVQRRAEALEDLFGQLRCLAAAANLDDHELVAADPSDLGRLRNARPQALGHLDDHLIADLVTSESLTSLKPSRST